MKDLWRTFCTRHSAVACTRQHFNRIFKKDWQDCLRFRQRGQHAECATCVHHKIVLRQLQHDAIGRAREASRWEEHKMAERADRRVYWSIRAEARVSAQYTRPGAIPGVISMIIDGMDQGKFAVPRFPFTKSKDLEGMQRPRLHVNVAMCHGHEILVTVSDANFPKDTNGTCEVIAHMLTRLSRQQQVAVHRCALHVQLDNTSAQNKNNILLGVLAWLTTRGRTLASEADFLRKGHTHEDVDQLNGQICSYMHRQPYAETPHDFVRHIQRFLDTELAKPPWPQGPGSRRCVYLNQQRDWKTFLRFVPALKQHTGPQAPHVFRYQRRGCCAPGLLRRLHCIEPLGIPADDRDAVLFCKRWMADESLSQRPLVQLPASKVPATEGVPMALQRNPITPKLANHLKKYSGLLARPPYKVERGAKYIVDWVDNRLPQEPALDTDGVLRDAPVVAGHLGVLPDRSLGPDDAPAVVALADAGPADDDTPSDGASLAYGVASILHVTHGIAWHEALATGKRASSNAIAALETRAQQASGQKRKRARLPRGHAVDLGGPPPGGLQPLDLVPR